MKHNTRISTSIWKLTIPLFLFFGLTSGLLPPVASPSPASWWDTHWTFRSALYFNAANITDDLVDFPVRVDLTTINFDFNKARSKGEDIRFIDQDNATALPYEIEWWDKAAKSAVIWVKVPRINANSSDTGYINMYYGNSRAADAQSKPKVWGDWLTISDGKSLDNWNYGHGVSLSLDNTGSAFLIKGMVSSPETGTEYTTDYNPAGSWNINEPSATINFGLTSSRASTAYTWTRLYVYDISGNYRYWNLTFTANTPLNASKPLRSGDGQSANPPDLAAIDYVRFSFMAKDTQAFTFNIGGVEVVWGAIGVWHFNEMTGTESSDSTRYATAGILKGGTTWSNYALNFDGKSGYLNLDYFSRERYLAGEFSTPEITTPHQGVATDGTYVYATDHEHLYKYDLAGKFIKKSEPIAPMKFGGITYYNGLVYAATSQQEPSFNKIYVYNQDLVKINQYNISRDFKLSAGGVGYFDNHFYVGESAWENIQFESRIVKYTTDFQFVEEFRLPAKLAYGIQGIEYIPVKDVFQANGHSVEFFTVNTAFDKSTIVQSKVTFDLPGGLQDLAYLNSTITLYNDASGEILFVKNNPPSIPLLNDLITKEYTVEAWFNAQGGEGQRRAIFETDVSFAISAEINSGNFLRCAVEGTGVIVNTDVFPKIGDWNSVAVTYQENNFAKIYYNGKELAEFAGRPVGVLAPRNFLRIGTYRGANDRWFDGLIDEVRLYNVANNASWMLGNEKNRLGILVRGGSIERGPAQGFRFGCAPAP